MAGASEGQAAFSKWLKTFLKDRGWQPAGSGFRFGDDMKGHTVSLETGNWSDPSYSSNKPVRWLFNIDITQNPFTASLPGELEESGIGFPNDSKGRSASLRVRIMPLLKTGETSFEQPPFEVQALFVFHGGLPPVSSASAVFFNPNTGTLRRPARKDANHEDYIFAALLGIQPRSDSFSVNVSGQDRTVTYGEVLDALQSAIIVDPKGSAPQSIAAYDITQAGDLDRLKADLSQAWDDAEPLSEPADAVAGEEDADDDSEPLDFSHLEVPENPDLLGIDPAVYRQINAMLQSGKQHLMLYGPPGTGKTSLARWIANSLPGGKWTLITGSSDWSSQDIIGGYQPIGSGDVDFVPGILLRAFDQPLIIDELNRCDIDKVIGPLFTVLSGQQTTLPYRTELSDKNSQPYVILPQPKVGAADHEFAPGPAWRLLATINSIDKASLYQMSYALSRRFGWVYVDAPTDLREFIRSFLARLDPAAPEPADDVACPLADLWRAINAVRVIGPAPIIDAIKAIRVLDPAAAFFGPANNDMRSAALDALDMVLLPMLDGIVHQDAMAIADTAVAAFGLSEGQARQVKARLDSVAI